MKGFVGNRAKPEGSIAEGWILYEIFTFCSLYLDSHVESRLNRERRFHEPDEEQSIISSEIFLVVAKAVGSRKPYKLKEHEMLQAHRYVLFNCESVGPFIEEYKYIIKGKYQGVRAQRRPASEVHKTVHLEFPNWFRWRVSLVNSFLTKCYILYG